VATESLKRDTFWQIDFKKKKGFSLENLRIVTFWQIFAKKKVIPCAITILEQRW
jgi:hypothetical protein